MFIAILIQRQAQQLEEEAAGNFAEQQEGTGDKCELRDKQRKAQDGWRKLVVCVRRCHKVHALGHHNQKQQKSDDVEHHVEFALRLRGEAAGENINAHMGIVAESHGEAEKARDDDGVGRDFEDPFGRGMEEIAYDDFITDNEGRQKEQQTCNHSGQAREFAEQTVVKQNNFFECHIICFLSY